MKEAEKVRAPALLDSNNRVNTARVAAAVRSANNSRGVF